MRILFVHAQTLYLRVSIPVVIRLARGGHEVVIERRRDRFRPFSDGYVRAHPTGVAIIDRRALQFVAELIGYEAEWAALGDEVRLEGNPSAADFDAVVGTTKDLERLREIRTRTGVRAVALGYQHMPYLVEAGDPDRRRGEDSLFLSRNEFTDSHRFLEILGGDHAVPNSFTFLDRVLERSPGQPARGETVLIFHPGGYRNVVTSPGDAARVCHEKQVRFFERACLPLIEHGLRPVIKIHPLRARHHDLRDVVTVVEQIEDDHGLARGTIRCIGPRGWFWGEARRAAFVVSYGSSSIYELWSAGIRSAVICNFEGTSRSEKFSLFESLLLNTYEEYCSFVSNECFRAMRIDPLTEATARAYEELCDGRATERAADFVAQAR